MPIHVRVLSDADYAAWVKSKKADAPAAEVKQASKSVPEQVAQAAVPVKN
jgi:heme/copper-type cytochrome/quinol oxidase subunit 2